MLAIRVECLVLTFNYVTNFIFHSRLDLLVLDIVILEIGLEILDTNMEVSDIVEESLDVGLESLDMYLELSDGNSVMINLLLRDYKQNLKVKSNKK